MDGVIALMRISPTWLLVVFGSWRSTVVAEMGTGGVCDGVGLVGGVVGWVGAWVLAFGNVVTVLCLVAWIVILSWGGFVADLRVLY